MKNFVLKTIFIVLISFALGACGLGSSGNDGNTEVNNDCVLESSSLGACTL